MRTLPQAAANTRQHDLRPGERITGTVYRPPQRGAFLGNSLILRLDDGEVVAIEATAKHGRTALERELERQAVAPGDRIEISFIGWSVSRAGHSYRAFRVEHMGPDSLRAAA